MTDERRKDGGLYKADSVPPPDDAYSAPTRIGVVSEETWTEAGNRPQEPEVTRLLNLAAIEKLSSESAPAPDGGLPQVYGEDEGDDAETALHPAAKAFHEQQRAAGSTPAAPPVLVAPRALPGSLGATPSAPVTASDSTTRALVVPSSRPGTFQLRRREITIGVVMFVVSFVAFSGAALLSWRHRR